MTLRRVVAFAQALTMIMLLLPGPQPAGSLRVRAAAEPADAGPVNLFDAAGKGIGCQAGTRKYKGPGLPKDPPWPPGAEPTPEPTAEPSAQAGAPTAPDASSEPTAIGPTALVAATDLRFMQAELEPAPVAPPSAPSAPNGQELLTGIDVSHHNGDIDYAKVKAAGHRFVYIKATQDIDFVDSMFATNLARARAAGLAAGAYHFFDYTLDGRAQADHFLDRVEAAGGIDDALPPVVDVECWGPIGASIHAVSTARLRDFIDRVYERTGRMPMIYTSVFMWREVVGNTDEFADLPLWAACWGCDAPPSLAPAWDSWAFWQVGLTRIPDVGRLDNNYFGGSRTQLDALKLRPFSLESGAIATSRQDVELDLGGRVATHIRTSTDGQTWSGWSRIRSTPTVQLPAEEGEYEVFAQLRYGADLRSPVVSDSISVDHTPPQMSEPTVSLRTGALDEEVAGIPIAVAWEASDAVAGLSDASVLADCGELGAMRAEAPGGAAPGVAVVWDAEASVFADATCAVTAISRDGAGNSSRETSVDFTTTTVAAAQATVEGGQVAVIASRGPDRGRAAVMIDGAATGLVDLYAPEVSAPEIVFVTELAPGSHAIEIQPTGSADAASTGTAAVADGYVTLAFWSRSA